MLPHNRDLLFRVGSLKTVEGMRKQGALVPFAPEVVDFLDALSRHLMQTKSSFSDVVSFAFWIRKANVLLQKKCYNLFMRLGRGIVFHSTPSNVPVNFAFSFAASLLAGNMNIVRLPAKKFAQVQEICDAINIVLNEHPAMAPYVVMLSYSSDKAISDYFSNTCNVRIVWGGDETINNIRKSPLPPRAKELTFADRFSVLVLNADALSCEKDMADVAFKFYNDTYFSDQNACTSPRMIFWLGKNKADGKKLFWDAVAALASKYTIQPVQAVGKLSALYRLCACNTSANATMHENFITRVEIKSFTDSIPDFFFNSGFFVEYDATSMDDVMTIADGKCQTLVYYGVEVNSITDSILKYRPQGIDRVVPLGKSMEFSLVWDGYDLITELSRAIVI